MGLGGRRRTRSDEVTTCEEMHTRTYADPKITKYQDKFVFVIVDPNTGQANRDLVELYTGKIQDELSEFLSFPTSVFISSDGKLLKAAVGKWTPDELEKLMLEVLSLTGKKGGD